VHIFTSVTDFASLDPGRGRNWLGNAGQKGLMPEHGI
jgi:hypothetical protein